MRHSLQLLSGMVVVFASCGRQPSGATTRPEPDDGVQQAAVKPEAPSSTDAEEASLQEVASSYFKALFTGDADGATRLATAPFSLDRKKVLQGREAVESVHQDIVRKKGKRAVPDFTISRTDRAPALDRDVFPRYAAFRVTVGREHIDIYVSREMPPKVIGFSD